MKDPLLYLPEDSFHRRFIKIKFQAEGMKLPGPVVWACLGETSVIKHIRYLLQTYQIHPLIVSA